VHNIGGEDTDFGYRAVRAGFRVGVESSPAVTHYGVKSGDAFESTRRTYQRGAGAFLDKHTRLGDPIARRRELAGLTAPLRQAAANVVRLRRPSGLGVARSFLAGVLTARRHYRVDPVTKLYVPR
jgi:GT2 family glycosyltransferase